MEPRSATRRGATRGGGHPMFRSAVKGQRLVVVFLLGVVLFNYPLLALFNRTASVVGIPVVYVYIFGAWALLIGLAALVIERSR
jgi:hypothetical protein